MLRFTQTPQTHTAYSESAMAIEHSRNMAIEHSRNMESRDHSNGVSPKNHKSRGNFLMKMLVVLWVLLAGSVVVPTEILAQDWNANPVVLSTSTHLTAFKAQVDGGNTFSGKTIALANNITWTSPGPIGGRVGSNNRYFEGTFDGRGYTVSFSSIVLSSTDYVGFFGLARNCTIKDLHISTNYIDGRCYVGGLVGELGGTSTIFNVHVRLNSTSDMYGSGETLWGGLIGQIWGTGTINISSCSVVVAGVRFNNNGSFYGGLTGGFRSSSNGGTMTISDCLVDVNFISLNNNHRNIGGLIGSMSYEKNITIRRTIARTSGLSSLGTSYNRGAVVGYVGWGSNLYLRAVYNNLTSTVVGGMVGERGTNVFGTYQSIPTPVSSSMITSWTDNANVYNNLERRNDDGTEKTSTDVRGNEKWGYDISSRPQLRVTSTTQNPTSEIHSVKVTRGNGVNSITGHRHASGTEYYVNANQQLTVTPSITPNARQRLKYSFSPSYNHSSGSSYNYTGSISGNNYLLTARVNGTVSAIIENIPYPKNETHTFGAEIGSPVILTWYYDNPQGLVGGRFFVYRRLTGTSTWTVLNSSGQPVSSGSNIAMSYSDNSSIEYNKTYEYLIGYYEATTAPSNPTSTINPNFYVIRTVNTTLAMVPINLTHTFDHWTNSNVTLSWNYNNPLNYGGKYFVYRKPSGTTTLWQPINPSGISVSNGNDRTGTHIDNTAQYNNTYDYLVAYDKTASTAPSDPENNINAFLRITKTVNTAVSSLGTWSVTATGGTSSINVSFNNHSSLNSHGATFNVERRQITVDSDGNDIIGNYDILGATGRIFTTSTSQNFTDNTGADPCNRYQYRITINAFGNTFSSESNVANTTSVLTFASTDPFTASKGEYNNYVRLQWKVNGQRPTGETYRVFRRVATNPDDELVELEIITSSNATVYWNDNNVLTGVYYEYVLKPYQICVVDGTNVETELQSKSDIGFTQAFGVVSGRVTYGLGTACQGVNLYARRSGGLIENQYHSLYSPAGGAKFEWLADQTYFNNIWQSKKWTLQFWVNPESSNTGTVVIGNIGGQEISMIAVEDGYQIFTQMSTAETSRSEVIPANHFSHIAITRDDDNIKIYTVLDQYAVLNQNPDSIKIEYTSFEYLTAGTLSAGDCRISFGHALKGYIDDVRFWNRPLSEVEVGRDYSRYLVGNENGLRGYWTFDENLPEYAFDKSRVGTVYNRNHATTNTLEFSTVIPNDTTQLALKDITDHDGNYMITGIPYMGEGTAYSIVPNLGGHQFSPTQQLRYISTASIVHNGTDFTNISAFPVTGRVTFANSNYPVIGATVSIDGVNVVKDGQIVVTDIEGIFSIDVPIGEHFITVSKPGHVFANGGRFPTNELLKHNFQSSLHHVNTPGLNFSDETTVRLMGRVVGGQMETDKTLGFGLSEANIGQATITLNTIDNVYRLNLTGEDMPVVITEIGGKPSETVLKQWSPTNGNVIEIKTNDETGEFVAELPPVPYFIAGISTTDFNYEDFVVHGSTMFDMDPNSPQTVEYTNAEGNIQTCDYHNLVKITRYNDPIITVRDLGAESGAFGDSIYKYVDNVIPENSTNIPLYTVNDITGSIDYALGYPVFVQETGSYTWEIYAFEEYLNPDNGAVSCVPLAEVPVDIDNGLASHTIQVFDDGISDDILTPTQQTLVLDDNGKVYYRFITGFPKLAGDHLLSANISLVQNGKKYFWENSLTTSGDFSGYLIGMRPVDGNNFVTQGPAYVDVVLHDPPGSNSYAYIEKGTSIVKEVTNTLQFNTNAEVAATLHLGPKFTIEGGVLFFSSSVETEIIADVTTGLQWSQSHIGGKKIVTATVFNEQISTSSDPNYVGAMADVYIGKSTNRIFSKQRNLALYPTTQPLGEGDIGTDGFKLNMRELTAVGQEFSTAFTYTQNYIVNTLIPNIKQLRNGLIVSVTEIPSLQSVTFDEDKNPLYFTTLSEDDADFGSNKSYVFYCATDAPLEKRNDMVADYNQWIANWERIISDNEKHKIDLFDSRLQLESLNQMHNRSFDSGVNISESVTVSFEDTVLDYEMDSFGAYNDSDIGGRIGGIGLVAHTKVSASAISETTIDNTNANDLTFGFVLADDGFNDALSVDIYHPINAQMFESVKPESEIKNLHGYTFKRRAGQTSCPHEAEELTLYYEPGQHVLNEGTFKVENPDLYINNAKTATLANIPAGREASFNLELQNMSDVNVTVSYQLWVDDMSNPDGLIISIDGAPLTTPRTYTIPSGASLMKIVKVSQSSIDILNYQDVKLVMGSACDDQIYSEVTFDLSFTPSSSPVTLSASSTVVNRETLDNYDGNIAFTISDYDRNFKNFGLIRLQYRNTTSQTWITKKEYVNDTDLYALEGDRELIESHFIVYDFNFTDNTPSDGKYIFRAVTVSKIGYDEIEFFSDEIVITKDVRPAKPLGAPSPANGILGVGDELSITFNEDIQSNVLETFNNFSITGILNAQEIASPTTGLAFSGAQSAQTELPIFTSGSFSIETWYKREPNSAGTLFSYGGLSLGFNAEGNAVVKIGGETHTSTTATGNDETWKYIAMSYNRDINAVSVYQFEGAINNPLFTNRELTAEPETQGTLIVGNNHAGNDGFNGTVSQLHFYGITRTSTDVSADKSLTKSGREHGLIGYWTLDEGIGNIAQDKARARHLTLGNTDWYIYPEGVAKQTDNNYIAIPTYTYPLHIFADFTLEFWFRSDNLSEGQGAVIFSSDNAYIATNEDGDLTLYKSDGTVIQTLHSPFSILNSQWHHIAISVRRGGNVGIYINGASIAQFPETLLGTFASAYYYFGAKRNADNTFENYFAGTFDEIRIWNSALTRDGILLNKNNKLHGNEAGLLAYYPFEKYVGGELVPTNENMALDNYNDFTAEGDAVNIKGVSVKDVRPVENVPFTFVASNNKIVFTIAPDYFCRVEGVTLNISVSNVLDMYNNVSATENWTAFVRRNPLRWDSDPVNMVMEEGELRSFTARITNMGGTTVSYSIENLPSWLTVSAPVGNLAPLANRDLIFSVIQGVNVGNYETAIGLTSGNCITETLPVQLKVTRKRPGWTVNPNDFENSMNITGQIKIDGVFHENPESLLAAFIGDLCVGIASPQYISEMNTHFTFATIYGNPQHNNQLLKFQLWDASTGRIYPVIEVLPMGEIYFAPSQVIGTPFNPVIFNTLDMEMQTIPLNTGWNWISVNVLNENPSILNQMKTSLAETGTLIKGRETFIQQPGWQGTLTTISEKTMYMVHVTDDHLLMPTGIPADPATTPIDIVQGWNWIGYIPSFNLPVKDALAGITDAQFGDQIKGQTDYAFYIGSGNWIPTMYMEPGKGYMYLSHNGNEQTLIYPSIQPFKSPEKVGGLLATAKWYPDNSQFSNSMTLTAIVVKNGEEQQSAMIEIAAFNEDECRGSTFLQYSYEMDRYIGFLMIYGENNEPLTLRAFDHETEIEYAAENAPIPFTANAIYGNPANPYTIVLGKEPNQPYETPIFETICAGNSYNFFGEILTEEDIYYHTLQAVNGADSIIILTLTVKPLHIIIASASNGSISPSNIEVCDGESQTFIFSPATCYQNAEVTLNGVPVSVTGNSFTIENVTADHAINVTFNPITYPVIALAGSGGTISPSGSQSVNCGSGQLFTATPSNCQEVDQWFVNGTIVQTGGATYSVSNVQANTTIMVTFKTATYSFTASAGSGGIVSPSGTQNVNCGGNQIFIAIPNNCQEVNQWTVNGSVVQTGGTSYTIQNVQANTTVSVTFKPITYSVTASAGTGGGISPSGMQPVNCGSNQEFTAIPNNCQEVNQWTLNGSVVQIGGANYTVSNVHANAMINVTFKTTTYTVTTSAGSGGSISPNGVQPPVNCGSNQLFTATPNSCQEVNQWIVNGSIAQVGGTTYLLSNVQANTTIMVTFKTTTYNVTATAGSGGIISPSGIQTVNCGGNQNFTAMPYSCQEVDKWTLNGSVAQTGGTTYTALNIQANTTVNVTFKPITYTVTATAGNGGNISPSGVQSVECGNDKTFTATPNDCQEVDQWTVNGNVVQVGGATYTVSNVQTNATVNVTFKAIAHTITASAGDGGTISPSGAQTVDCGSTQTFYFEPDTCYYIAQVLIDGINNPDAIANGSYTFENIMENHKIAVTFAIYTYNITVSAAPPEGGTVAITGAGGENIPCGTTIAVVAVANANYNFVKWTSDGIEVSTNIIYSFTATEDVDLVAHFKKDSVVSIVETQGIASLQVYPNPTSGEIQVTSLVPTTEGSQLQVTSIEVYDVMGRNVGVKFPSFGGVRGGNIAHLPTGIYFLRIQTDEGVVVRKVVKE